jgi:cytochrome P450
VTTIGYDPFAAGVQRDPYPHYAELLADAPVYAVPGRGMWAISRHADVGAALRRPDIFSSSIMADREVIPADQTLLGSDPPAHTRLRKRVEQAFAPRRIRSLEPRARRAVAALMAAFRDDGGGDLVAALSAPLPVIMIADLLGIDPARHADFKRWADAVIARGTGRPLPAEKKQAVDATIDDFKAFLSSVIVARGVSPADDVISDLVRSDQDGAGLSAAQVLNFAVLLLLGGSETTTNLIGNAVRALFAQPALLAQVRADRTLVPALVEETLRYDAPVQGLLRRTTSAVEISNQALPASSVVLLLLGAANRDPAVFPDPDRFRLDRGALKHLAFGAGPHYCLGATLARIEAQAALEAILALPNLRPGTGDVPLVDSFVLRGPQALPVAFD